MNCKNLGRDRQIINYNRFLCSIPVSCEFIFFSRELSFPFHPYIPFVFKKYQDLVHLVLFCIFCFDGVLSFLVSVNCSDNRLCELIVFTSEDDYSNCFYV